MQCVAGLLLRYFSFILNMFTLHNWNAAATLGLTKGSEHLLVR